MLIKQFASWLNPDGGTSCIALSVSSSVSTSTFTLLAPAFVKILSKTTEG